MRPDLCDPPSVEGGGQVEAELVSVGQSGQQSLKRIETTGGKASGGLKDHGRPPCGAGELPDLRADAIGKTADKIGLGALRELRFAAKASGIGQQTSTWRCSASSVVPPRPRRVPARPRMLSPR
jgi:hypothetical protein